MSRTPSTAHDRQGEIPRLHRRVAELESQLRDRERELQDLRSQKDRHRAVVDSIHAIVWEADPKTWQFTFVSEHAKAITGFPPEQWYEHDFWPRHMHPDDRDSAVAYCKESTARGTSHDFEYRMIAADGRVVWFRDIVTVLRRCGKPELLRGVMIDITRQREIEQQLRAHDQRLELLTSQMPAILWSVDRELRFTSSLGAGIERLGTMPNENVGLALEEYFAPDAARRGKIIEYHQQALAGQSVQYTTTWLGNSYECRVEPLRDSEGAIVGAIGLAIDVTDRERAEQQLRDSQHRWQSIFEFAVDPIWEWDIVADRTAFSPSWPRLLGFNPETFNPTKIEWQDLIHPDDQDRVWFELNRCLAGEVPQYNAEYRIRDRKSDWKWVVSRGVVAARDEAGRPRRMIGCVVDMTERRQLEESLRHRVAAESLLASISSDFINVESDELDAVINDALRRLGEFTGVDRAYVFLLSEDRGAISNTHEWCAEGIEPQMHKMQEFPVERVPWWFDRMNDLKPIYISNVEAMPEEAASERELLLDQSIRSVVAVPMSITGRLCGFLGFDSVRRHAVWSDEDTSLLGAIGNVIVNAIERCNTDRAIRENERFLKTLMSNLPGWVYRCRNDRDWTYEFSSDGIKEVLGYTPDELLRIGGFAINDLIHPDDREMVWQVVQEAVDDDQPFQLVYRMHTTTGEEKWVWEQGRAVKSDRGEVICLEGFVCDVTSQKRAEDDLRKREREYHAIVENTPDIISRFDGNLQQIYVNPVVERMTGYAPSALIGRHVDELPWPSRQRALWRQSIHEVMQSKRERVIEFDLDGPRGRLYLEARLVPEFDERGDVETVLAIARNVTKRKRAAIDLIRANETKRLLLRELDHRVRNNLASLAALVDITSRNASTIQDFAASIRGRVQAMTTVHSLLSKGHWTSVWLSDLLESLIPADLLDRFNLTGPDVRIGANQCTAMGMVAQELVANSLKYGALSATSGTVHVTWEDGDSAQGGAADEEHKPSGVTRLRLQWVERSGPAITSLDKPGLGTNLIQGLVRTELRGRCRLQYPQDGASHEFELEIECDDYEK